MTPNLTAELFQCHKCQEVKPVQKNGGTGYATRDDGGKVCYACCADVDREAMKAEGKYTLYLVQIEKGYKLTNWPGTLSFFLHRAPRVSRHNFAGKRYDVDFTGPDGKRWHGITYGDNTQICHVRRAKRTRVA